MAEYITSVPKFNLDGRYSFKAVIGTGTATMQIQLDNEGFNDITDGAFTETSSGSIELSKCDIQVVLTGDAKFYMKIIG